MAIEQVFFLVPEHSKFLRVLLQMALCISTSLILPMCKNNTCKRRGLGAETQTVFSVVYKEQEKEEEEEKEERRRDRFLDYSLVYCT